MTALELKEIYEAGVYFKHKGAEFSIAHRHGMVELSYNDDGEWIVILITNQDTHKIEPWDKMLKEVNYYTAEVVT